MMRSHLHIFVFFYIFESFFQTEYNRWNDTSLIVCTRSSHIRQLLRFGNIHHYIVILSIFPNNLSGINFFLRENKEPTSILQLIDSIGIGRTRFHRN